MSFPSSHAIKKSPPHHPRTWELTRAQKIRQDFAACSRPALDTHPRSQRLASQCRASPLAGPRPSVVISSIVVSSQPRRPPWQLVVAPPPAPTPTARRCIIIGGVASTDAQHPARGVHSSLPLCMTSMGCNTAALGLHLLLHLCRWRSRAGSSNCFPRLQ